VQAFKKGPDYIDPSWLSAASQSDCRSLDPFFIPDPDNLKQAFLKGVRSADISLIEGNHGLYDSLEADGSGSTAAVARTLEAPVILVVNSSRTSRSIAAIVMGCQVFEPETPIAGVILNNVAQGRHEAKLRQAIEIHCRIPVVGALPRLEQVTIPERHLGLVPEGENGSTAPAIEACRDAVEKYVDLEALLKIAAQAPDLGASLPVVGQIPTNSADPKVSIGVLRDRAFTFYYPENLEALEEAGARLVMIDSLQDAHLPEVQGLYIGGGFPEFFLQELSGNASLRHEIREAALDGMTVYAECGGLMYLARAIHWGSQRAEMVGVLPVEIEMTSQPQGHGYVQAECVRENPFFALGTVVRGHEFHNSRLIPCGEIPGPVFRLQRGSGYGGSLDGLLLSNVLACYTHLHASGAPDWAASLVAGAAGWSQARLEGMVS
jgi:cobyrinic acid a,c-diamide synthase